MIIGIEQDIVGCIFLTQWTDVGDRVELGIKEHREAER